MSKTRRQLLVSGTLGAAGVAAAAIPTVANSEEVIAQQEVPVVAESSVPLAGKTAIVTGAGRAIGRACAVQLAQAGANIVATDIADPNAFPYLNYPMASQQDLAETQRLVEQEGRQCLAIQADVRSMSDMRNVVSRTLSELGRLDIMVANAGLVPSVPLTEMTDQQWGDVIDVNLTGTGNSIRAVLPHMVEQEQGQIIAISSTLGRQGNAGNAYYVASKWGVIGLVKSAALEAGPHSVTVNAVAPTGVRTIRFPEDPERRQAAEDFLSSYNALPVILLEPEDVADSVVFLASPQAKYITGAVIDVAAGANARYTG